MLWQGEVFFAQLAHPDERPFVVQGHGVQLRINGLVIWCNRCPGEFWHRLSHEEWIC